MKREKIIVGLVFIVVVFASASFIQKMYADCEDGTCFDYNQAFSVCENLCVARGHIGCAEPWWFAASCVNMQQCKEAFWIICQDGYSVKGFSTDFCASCF